MIPQFWLRAGDGKADNMEHCKFQVTSAKHSIV